MPEQSTAKGNSDETAPNNTLQQKESEKNADPVVDKMDLEPDKPAPPELPKPEMESGKTDLHEPPKPEVEPEEADLHESLKLKKKYRIFIPVAIGLLIVIVAAALNLFPSSPSLPVMMGADWSQSEKSSNGVMSSPYVWGNDLLKRETIRNITFLDSMDNVPSDAWDISSAGNGSVKAWVIKNGDMYDMFIAGNGGIQAPADCSYLFADYRNLSKLNFNNCFYVNNSVTDMSGMFQNCRILTQLDVSRFDTSSVTDMSWMFWNCSSLTNRPQSRI